MNLTQFYRSWFGTAPQNAKYASTKLTISGNVADGQTVTLNGQVFEFDTNGAITSGNVKVDVSVGGVGNVNAAAKLAAAINANSTTIDAFDILHNGEVEIQSKWVGTEGNDVVIAETLGNGAFDGGATKLSGGQYATPCACPNSFIIIAGTWYVTTAPVDKYNTTGWSSFTPAIVS